MHVEGFVRYIFDKSMEQLLVLDEDLPRCTICPTCRGISPWPYLDTWPPHPRSHHADFVTRDSAVENASDADRIL